MTSTKPISLRLTIDVTIDPNGMRQNEIGEITQNLQDIASAAYANGAITGNTAAEIVDYRASTKQI